MAGNPYTESGGRFRIPDMLANRADVWNLGDVLSGRDELFALSYIDNALTSNPVLSPLSTRDRGDIRLLVRLARGDSGVRADQLSHPYSSVELEQVLAVLRKLLRVQRVVLANNRAYIASAARSDASRTEPPFQLQGSYRNMNKLAARVVPVMNDAELEAVIDDHYLGEAQTLTSGAEANLLKLAELRGTLTPVQAARWAEVKTAYLRSQALGGAEDDPMTRAVGAVGLLADRVSTAIEHAADRLSPDHETRAGPPRSGRSAARPRPPTSARRPAAFTTTRDCHRRLSGNGHSMATKPEVRVRRVYEEPTPQDGARVLVDRIWPRGLSKEKADLEEWCKAVAPSTELRTWYGHDPARFEEFGRRYRAELKDPERAAALEHLREMARSRTVTLLTATRQADISEAVILADLLRS